MEQIARGMKKEIFFIEISVFFSSLLLAKRIVVNRKATSAISDTNY